MSKYEKLSDLFEILKVKKEHMGITGLTQFVKFNSSPRGEMLSRQLSKALTLNNGEVRYLLSGLEEAFAKTVFDYKVENEIKIFRLLPKYNDTYVVEVILIYQDMVTEEFDFLTIPRFAKHNPKFGHRVKWTDGLLDLSEGDTIPAGTILANSVGVSDEGNLKYGVNVMVALTSNIELAEDAISTTKNTLKRFQYDLEMEYELELKNGELPINKYGTIDNPRVLPIIGEKVPLDGYLFAKRTDLSNVNLNMLTKAGLMKFDPIHDKGTVTKFPNGVVTDVYVSYNSQAHNKPIMGDLEEYIFRVFHICDSYEENFIKNVDSINTNFGYDAKVGNELHCETVRLKMKRNPKIRPSRKKSAIAPFTITIKVRHTMTPTVGAKWTGLNGDKGVVATEKEEHEMPIDSAGNRAGACMYFGSTIGRMNIGRVYEQYLTGSIVHTRKLIKKIFKEKGHKEAWDTLLTYLKIFGGSQYEEFKDYDVINANRIIEYIDKHMLYVYLPLDNPKLPYQIVIDLANSELFRQPKGPVSFVVNGEEKVTVNSIIIAPMYLALLDKIADNWLANSSPFLNHFSLPTSPMKTSSGQYPYSHTPVRFGNTEFRLYGSYSHPELLVRLKERANSLLTQALVCKNILLADNPMDIYDLAPRDQLEFGSDMVGDIIKNTMSTFGTDLVYTKEVR